MSRYILEGHIFSLRDSVAFASLDDGGGGCSLSNSLVNRIYIYETKATTAVPFVCYVFFPYFFSLIYIFFIFFIPFIPGRQKGK